MEAATVLGIDLDTFAVQVNSNPWRPVDLRGCVQVLGLRQSRLRAAPHRRVVVVRTGHTQQVSHTADLEIHLLTYP